MTEQRAVSEPNMATSLQAELSGELAHRARSLAGTGCGRPAEPILCFGPVTSVFGTALLGMMFHRRRSVVR